ncbi:hypothetical protein IV01_06895 [Pseudomonas syringae]|uniref:Uncharacterized protein n=1 Tax=Pseudomonas syringae TaxID=317 RepID=A0A085VN88_PSESX|nr:hypothetical protein IV01_06895 [Pseudomonas syringae]
MLTSPRAYKRRELAVAAVITLGLDLLEKCFGASAIVLCPERIGFQRLFQRVVERVEFVEGRAPLVRRLSSFRRYDPFSNGVSRQPGTLGYLVQRELVAEVHPPDFSQHFHADHPVFSCSESEQKQLNTWVSFRSAATASIGRWVVSGNGANWPKAVPLNCEGNPPAPVVRTLPSGLTPNTAADQAGTRSLAGKRQFMAPINVGGEE